MSQLITADKLVWQSLLKEGIKPRRDETGDHALNEAFGSLAEL